MLSVGLGRRRLSFLKKNNKYAVQPITISRIVVVLLILMMLCVPFAGCLGQGLRTDDNEKIMEDPEGEAYNFSLAVIDTYFSGDFQAYLGLLAATMYSMESNETYPRDNLTFETHLAFGGENCQGCNNYTDYNMTYYLQVYESGEWRVISIY